MIRYRIVVKTNTIGENLYYIQYKSFFFWKYLREYRDLTMYPYKIECETIELAKAIIQGDIKRRRDNKLRKIIKTQIVPIN